MFWKKRKDPSNRSAQHSRSLFGLSMAHTPEMVDGETHQVDVNTELFAKNNIAMAKLVVIAGLLMNDVGQRSEILRLVEAEMMGEKSFEGYLFSRIRESLKDNARVSLSEIAEKIPGYVSEVDGEATRSKSLEEYYYKWSQILSMEPTHAEVQKALEIIQKLTPHKP